MKSKPDIHTIYVSGRKIRGEVMLDIELAFAGKPITVYIVPVVFERPVATKCLILNRISGTEGQYETWAGYMERKIFDFQTVLG